MIDGRTDVELPRKLFSAWHETGKAREIIRPLADDERRDLERRRDSLAPALDPFGPRDLDRVALAIAEMFSGYPSMRQTDDEAVAKVGSLRGLLSSFPAWSIEKTCQRIRTEGFERDGRRERNWPPSDAEIVNEVRKTLKPYADAHRSSVALLTATVEA